MDNLSRAAKGNYDIVLSLLSCLDRGLEAKALVDSVVDDCKFRSDNLPFQNLTILLTTPLGDHIANLREEVLRHRLQYAVSSGENNEDFLGKAAKAIEK